MPWGAVFFRVVKGRNLYGLKGGNEGSRDRRRRARREGEAMRWKEHKGGKRMGVRSEKATRKRQGGRQPRDRQRRACCTSKSALAWPMLHIDDTMSICTDA